MLSFLKNKLSSIYHQVTQQAKHLFLGSIDEQTLKELEKILLAADTGVTTTRHIITNLKTTLPAHAQGQELKQALARELTSLLLPYNPPQAQIYVLVGVNGSGKTTFAAKLSRYFHNQHKKVLLVAADTFRAAATEQLQQWATKTGAAVIKGTPNQDPASVVFQGCEQFKKGNHDILIIDTAGRLQTKTNLMKELEKIKRSITRQFPDQAIITLLTIDAMLGQNSLEQAKLFHESTHVDGIVLTKMDGTGKGGIVFPINRELHIPIAYISYGETLDDMTLFNPTEYVHQLLEI